VDGLRTVAVTSVLCFHLDHAVLPGGFVGVDIFFVISGFLISSVLLQDMERRSYSILRFYQHRIARIAPAMFLVVALTLAAGAVIYSTQDFALLCANAAAAAISVINIKLLFQAGYFQASPDAQPLLHYWTLAVEEQFYLIFPPLLFLLVRFVRRQIAVTLTLCAASFVLCVVMTAGHPTLAFYLLPTRAWELLAGCALALYRRGGGCIAPRAAGALGWLGLALMGASFFAIDEKDAFPGWIAAAPVAGAALVLAAAGYADGLFSRLLAHPAAVFVGKRSYSLYLWHWPVFSFVDYALFQAAPGLRLALKIVFTIVGTLVTYEVLEAPARRFLNRPTSRLFAFAGFAVIAGAVLTFGVYMREHDYLSASPHAIAAGGIEVNTQGRPGVVVVVGDSQGAMYGTELASIAKTLGFRLNLLSASGENELAGEPHTYWPGVRAYLARTSPDLVIVAESWTEKLGADPAALRRAIYAVTPYARHVMVLAQPPIPPPNASRAAIRAGARAPFFELFSSRVRRQRVIAALENLGDAKIEVLNLADSFLNRDGSIRLIGPDGRLTFLDFFHLTNTGTEMVHGRLAAAIEHALSLGGSTRSQPRH
jgi:peptidoglycan/LPS O-acetylase OafA/YrhL